MAERKFIESSRVYFDMESWGFRTIRGRIDSEKVVMSYPQEFWNDSITGIVEEHVSQKRLKSMIPVPRPDVFALCKWHEFKTFSDGAYRIIPLKDIVGRYILIATMMKYEFDDYHIG